MMYGKQSEDKPARIGAWVRFLDSTGESNDWFYTANPELMMNRLKAPYLPNFQFHEKPATIK